MEGRKPTEEEVDAMMERLQAEAPGDAGLDWGDGKNGS
jgi:hypothetical protein